MAKPPRPDPLPLIAARLSDIAATVGKQAESATALVREAGEQARAAALLAADVDAMAASVEASVRLQAELIATARQAAADGLPVIDALTAVADRIGTMSSLIDDIAKRSRMLALNARIEGARAGAAGMGFDVVATEMSSLARQTREATGDIDQGAADIADHVTAAREVFELSARTVDRHDAVASAIVDTTRSQTLATSKVARLSGETVAQIDHAAAIIGRVASAAQAVDLLARQLTRLPAPAVAA